MEKMLIYICLIIIVPRFYARDDQFKLCSYQNNNNKDFSYRIFVQGSYQSNASGNREEFVTFDFVRNNFTSCLIRESRKVDISQSDRRILLDHLAMSEYYLDVVENVNDHECFPRPATLKLRKMEPSSNLANSSNRVITFCVQQLPVLFFPRPQTKTALHTLVNVNYIKTIEINEGGTLYLPLMVRIPVPGSCYRVQLVWTHTYLDIDNNEEQVVTTKMIKEKTWMNCGKITNESLTLENVDTMDSGEYQAIVTQFPLVNPLAETAYSIKVISKKIQMNLFVKHLQSREIQNPQFLEKNVKYRFSCSEIAYPLVDLRLTLTYPCENFHAHNVEMVHNLTIVTGTFRRVLFADVKVGRNGIITCYANNETFVQPFIVSDIKHEDYGLTVRTVETNETNRFVVGDNLTLMISVQKQMTSVKCYQNNGENCADEKSSCSGPHCLDSWYRGCPMILDARAQEVSTCFDLATDWYFNTSVISKNVEIVLDDSGSYSNKIIIHVKNVSRTDDAFRMVCFARSTNSFTRPKVSSITIDTYWAKYPVYSNLPRLEMPAFDHNDLIKLYCGASGWPPPAVLWTHNGKILNMTNVPFKHLAPDLDRDSWLIFQIKTQSDYGDYCCNISNRIGSNSTCVHVPFFTFDYLNIDMFRVIIFGFLLCKCLAFAILTPATFIRRNILKAKRQKEQILLVTGTKNEENVYLEQISTKDEFVADEINKIYLNPQLEMPLSNIQFSTPLGCGNFGKVYKGLIRYTDAEVAVKTTKDKNNTEQMESILNELKYLLYVGTHENILGLIGFCTNQLPEDVYLITEYCHCGSLDDFLEKRRGTFIDELLPLTSHPIDDSSDIYLDNKESLLLTTADLISYGFQVANGMEYLSSKHVVHRDLALRNLLQSKDGKIKISDFGLSRDSYYYLKLKGQRLPLKWMAIESVISRKYSTKSDVWSYGIVLWEIFSLAEEPYTCIPLDESLIQWLMDGNRLEQPRYAPAPTYELMKMCWQHKPEDRPNFTECKKIFGRITLNSRYFNVHNTETFGPPSPNKTNINGYHNVSNMLSF